MNPTDFSVLLLAWDDADPAVVVLGGSALPPTLPLVYQLAAQHPVLALYPHLPAAETTAALEAAAASSIAAAAATPAVALTADDLTAAPCPLDVVTDAPGVHLLPPAAVPHSFFETPAASGSRLVGLDDLLPAIQRPLPTSHSLSLPSPSLSRASGGASGAGNVLAVARPSAAARSQWPANAGPLREATWQAPAAPYVGAAAVEVVAQISAGAHVRSTGTARIREHFPPPPPAPPRPEPTTSSLSAAGGPNEAPGALEALAASKLSAASPGTTMPASTSPAIDSDLTVPAHFDEPVEEIGTAEASALAMPEDDLVPDATLPAAPAASATPEPAASTPEPATTWTVRQPALNGLNFRMIQYARQAAQLIDDRTDFGVIYAPGWPAWLAALEIRNRSGQPLVLYAAALASDIAPAAERGWLLGLERMVLRRARLVLVPDADVLRQLRARHAEMLGEVRIVPAEDEVSVQLVLAEVARG